MGPGGPGHSSLQPSAKPQTGTDLICTDCMTELMKKPENRHVYQDTLGPEMQLQEFLVQLHVPGSVASRA